MFLPLPSERLQVRVALPALPILSTLLSVLQIQGNSAYLYEMCTIISIQVFYVEHFQRFPLGNTI